MPPIETKQPMTAEYRCTVDLDSSSTLTLTDQNLSQLKQKLQHFLGENNVVFQPSGIDPDRIAVYHKGWMGGDYPAGEINVIYKVTGRSISQRLQLNRQSLQQVAA
jgi:hypothetical protein